MTRSRRVTMAALMLTGWASIGTPARADTTEEDLAKYSRLRERLVTDFTSVGPDPGQSQPCPERNDLNSFMHWGDGTIALGFYIGVLATEHYMLSTPRLFPGADEGDDGRLDRTLDELYHALLALERLDESADAAFPEPCTMNPSINGFFIRDDVPADFNAHFPGINIVTSDFTDPVLTNKEESQDQVYPLQSGLALVRKLVPEGVVVQGRDLRAWAMEQAERIARHFAHGDWLIRNPACDDRRVDRGDVATAYAFGESMAVAFLTDGAFVPGTPFLSDFAWDSLRVSANPTYDNPNNLHMALAIIAVGDGYGADTPDVIATLAELQDWPLYPLLHRVLHDDAEGFCETAPDVNARARAMLDELPADAEPACPRPNGPAPHGWTTHNRFIRSADQAYVGPEGCDGMRYHGLDYMLLHNLYAIATPATWQGPEDADPCAPLPDPEPDAGVGTDASVPGQDSGIPPGYDAGGLDGGGPGAPDAGAVDGGADSLDGGPLETPPGDSGGCDCATGPGANRRNPWALLICLGLLPIARRRRSTS